MDIKLKKRSWYIRHKNYLLLAAAVTIILIVNIVIMAGPRTIIAKSKEMEFAEVKTEEFREYLDVEGIVKPILSIKINSHEQGYVRRIVAHNGSMLDVGDTIMVCENPELMRTIEEERLAWEKLQMNNRLQQYQMEQKSLTLRQQVLQTEYDITRLSKSYNLDKEEAAMGIKSKAQLEVAEDEYNYNLAKARLTLESLRHDSAVNDIQRAMLANELATGRDKYDNSRRRISSLAILSPVKGQLSYVTATPGQIISAGESIAEINILDDYKVETRLSEYYIDRISTGLPATITYQGNIYHMQISRVIPEVKDRTFGVELTFTGEKPENTRIGKSYRVQIELGSPEKCIVIPRDKFYTFSNGQYVYKINKQGTAAVRTSITIGRQNPKQFEVIDGVQPGDKIIISDYSEYGDAEKIILRNF